MGAISNGTCLEMEHGVATSSGPPLHGVGCFSLVSPHGTLVVFILSFLSFDFLNAISTYLYYTRLLYFANAGPDGFVGECFDGG